MMFAAGMKLVFTIFSGVTMNVPGASPIEHFNIARLHTCLAISSPPGFDHRPQFWKRSLRMTSSGSGRSVPVPERPYLDILVKNAW